MLQEVAGHRIRVSNEEAGGRKEEKRKEKKRRWREENDPPPFLRLHNPDFNPPRPSFLSRGQRASKKITFLPIEATYIYIHIYYKYIRICYIYI